MRNAVILACLLAASPAVVAAQAKPATPTAPAPATAAPTGYSVEDTEIGTLLDDPAAKAVVDKHIPGFSSKDQIDMARSMTLKSVQQYSPDLVTDKVLADIQTDLSKLPAKK